MKHLRYFLALVQHGHFGRAAEACSVSQPALSVQIKELETILGSQLVERGARQIHLTGLGEAVAARARDILLAVDETALLSRIEKRFKEEGRADDNPETYKVRLQKYKEQTEPLVAFYKKTGKVVTVDGMAAVEAVAKDVGAAVDAIQK